MKYASGESGVLKVSVIVCDSPAAMVRGRLGFDVPPFTLVNDIPFTSMSVMVWSVLPAFLTLTNTWVGMLALKYTPVTSISFIRDWVTVAVLRTWVTVTVTVGPIAVLVIDITVMLIGVVEVVLITPVVVVGGRIVSPPVVV